jgi:hypothetical protein
MTEMVAQPGRKVREDHEDRQASRWYGWLTAPSVIGGVASIGDIVGVRTWHQEKEFSTEAAAEALRSDLTRVSRDGWKVIAEVVREEPRIMGQQTLFDTNVFVTRSAGRGRAFSFWPKLKL